MDNNEDICKKILKFLGQNVSWLEASGPGDDIAICSRVRLARNVSGEPFPIAADQQQRDRIRNSIEDAIRTSSCMTGKVLQFQMDGLTELQRQIFFERRLISAELTGRPQGAALIVASDETHGVMINEEDHLRIQALCPGLQLEKAWQMADRLDNCFAEHLPYAYDSQLGYLTCCPTNVGTGMRASVMLHLPGLLLSGQLSSAMQGIRTLGLAVRGIYGEGTENHGGFFQISNQSTLGESEKMIIDRLHSVISQLIVHEKNSRAMLVEHNKYKLLNHVGRAYGKLRHSYLINFEEALNALSALRIGVDMHMFSSLSVALVNELLVKVSPAHLQLTSGGGLSDDELAVKRAELIRETLKNVEPNR
jgi:protein arginine kinase